MPHVDSLLSLVHKEGANELRIGTDRSPLMFALGTQKRLSIPKTSADTVRHLMGELLSAEVREKLRAEGRAEIVHAVAGVGPFQVKITSRGSEAEIDVVFLKAPPAGAAGAAPAETGTGERTRPPEAAPAPAPQAVAPGDREARPVVESRARVAFAVDARTSTPLPAPLLALLRRAHAMGASDLHLASGDPPSVRVHGVLRPLGDEAASEMAALVEPLLDERSRDRLANGASVDLAATLPLQEGGEASSPRLRINVYRTASGAAAAIRLLPDRIPHLAELGYPVPISDLASLPNGLVILAGPTGCGKSTTLAALAAEALRARSIALLTLEDPIEYTFAGSAQSVVRQRQIGRDARDFATGLRDALREDPDVILVGEMRDPESIGLALTAAETGHLVLTTLHSRSAAATIERIVDGCPESGRASLRAQLADSLRAVVSQRLLPRAAGDGRVLAAEVLRVTTSVANGLREGKLGSVVSAMQSGRKDGMLTLERCLADLVKRREVMLDVARAAANDREALQSYLAGP